MPYLSVTPSRTPVTVLRQRYVATCAGDAVGVISVLHDTCGVHHAAVMIWWHVGGRQRWTASRGVRSTDVLLYAIYNGGTDGWPVVDAEVYGTVRLNCCKAGVSQPMQHGATPQALLSRFA